MATVATPATKKDWKPNGPDRPLYWSPLSVYLECHQRYLWQYGWVDIDCGGGMGKPRTKPLLESQYYSAMGDIIQGVLEQMYNEKWWLDPATFMDKIVKDLGERFNQMLDKVYIDWTQAPLSKTNGSYTSPRDEMYNTCYSSVMGFLKTMKANRLIGSYCRCEVPLEATYGGIKMAGRADFLIVRKDTGVHFYDGKNSLTKGKYTDPDQLRWYAALYYLQTGVVANTLGFIYYRYPAGEFLEDGTLSTGIDPVTLDHQDINRLLDTAVEARAQMIAHNFQANPVPKNCQLCPFESTCSERQEQRELNSRKRFKPKESIPIGGVTMTFGD